MSRVYNFSAGPSMLPESVLNRAAAEMLDYKGSGQSVMEMSHRSKVFMEIAAETQALFREVLGIPENYKVLFLQGGASTQFAAIPLNFMNGKNKADYVLTGQFSTKAYKEACKYGECRVVASSKEDTFSYIPKLEKKDFDPEADYAYICYNNTIYGTTFNYVPDTGDVPLFA
ncbi:MAG: aminotransferase class V-fold PLP-dependent enzyme, partial [Clostridia bacterium]|nr:aminotransferase class V-fold PLP-dependent enzyme [Clostridia bacterium]